jgi:hypothetical protein
MRELVETRQCGDAQSLSLRCAHLAIILQEIEERLFLKS